MTTQKQRIVDLVYAGHAVPEVANLLGVNENAVRDALQDLTQVPTSQGGSSPQVETPAVASGAPVQDGTGSASEVYVGVTGHAAGTVTIAVGPTNAVADTIINAADASVNRTINFRLPAGWFYEVTVAGGAAIAGVKQITG